MCELTPKEKRRKKLATLLAAPITLSLLAYIGTHDKAYACNADATVVSIDSVDSRHVTFTLDDSTQLTRLQPDIELGGKYCLNHTITHTSIFGKAIVTLDNR